MTITDALAVAAGSRIRRGRNVGTVTDSAAVWLTVRWTDGTEERMRRSWLFPLELLPSWEPGEDAEGGSP